jgi:hypothetical protein
MALMFGCHSIEQPAGGGLRARRTANMGTKIKSKKTKINAMSID